MGELITFDFIYECWKKKEYPEGFDKLLEEYLELKNKIFSDLPVKISNYNNPYIWLNKIVISIEIGILRDKERFEWYKNYWQKLLNRKWIASIEDKWVKWDGSD